MLGGGGNPAAWWRSMARATSHDAARHGDGHDRRSPRATTRSGSRSTTTVSEPADVWWAPVETVSNSEAGFERVYQGAGLLLSWPLRLAGRRLDADRRHVTQAVTTDRATGAATEAAHGRRRPTGRVRPCRSAGHREPRPARRPRPLLPAVAHGSVQRVACRPIRRRRRPTTGPPASAPSATGPTPSSATSPTCRGTSARPWPAWLEGGDPVAYRGFVAGDARRQRPRPAVPPHDPAARLGCRPAGRDPLGAARLRAALRPARQPGCGCPRRRSTCPRSGCSPRPASEHTILAPWQAIDPHVDTRRPYRVDLGAGRSIVVALYDAELSAAVSFDPRATADADAFSHERLEPRLASEHAPRRRAAAGRDRHRRRAVRPPPAVPRALPRAAPPATLPTAWRAASTSSPWPRR